MNIDNIKIDEAIYSTEFTVKAMQELDNLLTEIKEEYRPYAEKIGKEIIKTYKEISEKPHGEEQDRLKESLSHLEAGITHCNALVEIKFYNKVIKICEIALNIAIKIAIASIIAL